jgi:nucleotide-binding universal stress UspA family protein
MYKKILVPLDGSPLAETVLPHAQALAISEGAEIVLLRVPMIPNPEFQSRNPALITNIVNDIEHEAEMYVDTKVSKLISKGAKASGMTRDGSVPETILAVADEIHADVIAMSTHGRTGISRWLMGSVADKIVHHAHIPVMLIHPN